MSAPRSDISNSTTSVSDPASSLPAQYVVRLWLHGEYVGGLYGVHDFEESQYSLCVNTGPKGSMSLIYKTTGFSWVIEEFK